jgi:signal peptidase I
MVSKTTVIYVAAFAILLFWAYFVQADTRRVDGTSMLPTLEGGDLVVIQGAAISDVHVGDIIVYGPPCSLTGSSVIHRVVSINAQGLVTKGDNNPSTDLSEGIAVSPITSDCLQGKVVFVIPYVESLAYYIDSHNLPEWLNYIPSIVILIIVMASVLLESDEDEEGEKTKVPLASSPDVSPGK